MEVGWLDGKKERKKGERMGGSGIGFFFVYITFDGGMNALT